MIGDLWGDWEGLCYTRWGGLWGESWGCRVYDWRSDGVSYRICEVSDGSCVSFVGCLGWVMGIFRVVMDVYGVSDGGRLWSNGGVWGEERSVEFLMGCLWSTWSGDKRLSKLKNLQIWKVLSLSILQKMTKVCSGENTKSVSGWSLLKRDNRCLMDLISHHGTLWGQW